MGNSVPGGWFIGRPANNADGQTQAAANTQTSRDFLVGTPENLRPQAAMMTTATEQQQTAGELRRSRSFMDFKGSGSSTEENRVLLRSCTEVNAHNMENKRVNRRNDNPRKLAFELIKQITNDFSEELGRGSFGQVFKGMLEDGEEVAVKMLRFMGNINDQQFENEFEILKRLEHPNIVQLVAFCDEAQEVCIEYNGKLTVCQRIHKALCLEYMPNGSLGKLLHGENLDKNWPIRYSIIKGICEGLKYLQEGLEFPIFHLDLKPDNILLNEEMLPKISDFGLSRLVGEENTKKTLTPLGTIGYLPPEFINHQVISKEYDIYSLGVIVTKIITGTTGYSVVADMGAEEFVELVHKNWEKCLQEIPRYESLEVDCEQVKRCIEIARRCMENDRHKRPTINDIVSQLLAETELKIVFMLQETKIDSVQSEDCFRVQDWYPSSRSASCSQSEDCLVRVQDWYPSSRSASCSPEWSYGEARYARSASCSPGWFYREAHFGGPASCSPEWSYGNAHYGGSASCSSEWSDMEAHYWSAGFYPEMSDVKARYRSSSAELILVGSSHNAPPSEITHPVHPEHKLKLMTDAGAPFLCDGCKEPGYGPRYACDCSEGGQSLDLHTCCALADDFLFGLLFGLQTLVHPLFGYGKNFDLRFLHEY